MGTQAAKYIGSVGFKEGALRFIGVAWRVFRGEITVNERRDNMIITITHSRTNSRKAVEAVFIATKRVG